MARQKVKYRPAQSGEEKIPERLPIDAGKRLVTVMVEGYEDVAFWRGIFDHFRNPYLRFEISVPNRDDLPKGKKVLMSMIDKADPENVILCVDSDFDYLFDGATEQSREVLRADNMFHTYVYATENFLCYAPSLRNVCVKATKTIPVSSILNASLPTIRGSYIRYFCGTSTRRSSRTRVSLRLRSSRLRCVLAMSIFAIMVRVRWPGCNVMSSADTWLWREIILR